MMWVRLVRYLRGWVRVRCRGAGLSRFVNSAAAQGLPVFDVCAEAGEGAFSVPAADYPAAARLLRRCGLRGSIESRRGLILTRKALRRALPLTAGLAVFLAVVLGLGQTVFTVEVEGSSAIPRAAVEKSLAHAGVRVGVLRKRVDVKRAEQILLLENHRLSWAALNLSFGRAVVVAKDKTPQPQSGVGAAGMKLAAARDARITRVALTGGVPLVKAGDVVKAGQDLALPDGQTGAGSWTAAVEGQVYAYTAYKETFVLPLQVADRAETGESVRRARLSLGNISLPLTPRSCPYAFYDAYHYSRPLTLFSVRLPLRLEWTEYRAVRQTERVLTPAAAQLRLEETAARFLRETGREKRVVGHSASFAGEKGRYFLTLSYTCEENIGIYMECE